MLREVVRGERIQGIGDGRGKDEVMEELMQKISKKNYR
jgi:hypothetical protein